MSLTFWTFLIGYVNVYCEMEVLVQTQRQQYLLIMYVYCMLCNARRIHQGIILKDMSHEIQQQLKIVVNNFRLTFFCLYFELSSLLMIKW